MAASSSQQGELADVLARALYDGDAAGIRAALTSAAPPRLADAVDGRGNTLCHIAAECGESECLAALIAGAGREQLEPINWKGMTPLHVAAQSSSLSCVDELLQAGASLDARNLFGETPMHLAAAAGQSRVVERLIVAAGARGYDWAAAVDRWHRSAAQVAREQGEPVVMALLCAGSDPVPDGGPQPPSAAGALQRAQLQRELMAAQSRARPLPPRNVTIVTGPSGLLPAARPAATAQSLRALSKLIEFPGDARAIGGHLDDPSVSLGGRDIFGLAALHKFAAWNRPELVELLLARATRDEVNAVGSEHGFTALHFAAEAGAKAAFAALLASSLVVSNIRDKSGQTGIELLAVGSVSE
ncbi:ankyrin repeat-containing domain protein [Pavlovales sp. CCMP2436]|nr:ankyrin repeat-containing domain protein [Pavlovales sp. CCMP2436]